MHRQMRIGQTRTADGREVVQLDRETPKHLEMIGQTLKTLEFASFGPLPVARMQRGYLISTAGNGCSYTAVHSAAHQHHGFRHVAIHFRQVLHFIWLNRAKSTGQTPRALAPQMYLWSCNWSRTGSPSSRIQRARSVGRSSSCEGENKVTFGLFNNFVL